MTARCGEKGALRRSDRHTHFGVLPRAQPIPWIGEETSDPNRPCAPVNLPIGEKELAGVGIPAAVRENQFQIRAVRIGEFRIVCMLNPIGELEVFLFTDWDVHPNGIEGGHGRELVVGAHEVADLRPSHADDAVDWRGDSREVDIDLV